MLKNEWIFKLRYEDKMGFSVIIEGFGFKSMHQAKIRATKKQNKIETFGL